MPIKQMVVCDFCRHEIKGNYAIIKISFSDDEKKNFLEKDGDSDLAIFCMECMYSVTTFIKNLVRR